MVRLPLLLLLAVAALTSATTTTCPQLGSGTMTLRLTKNQPLVFSLSTTKTSTVTLCLNLGSQLPTIDGTSKSTTTLLPGTELRELRIEFPNFVGVTELRIDSWDLRFGTNCTSNLVIPVQVLDSAVTQGSLVLGNCSSAAEPFGFATTALVNTEQRLNVALLGGACSLGTTAMNNNSVCTENGPAQTQSVVTVLDNWVSDFDMNGVVYHLGSSGKKYPFSPQRLRDAGVTVTVSKQGTQSVADPPDLLYRLTATSSFTVTDSSIDQYYQIDLGARHQLLVTKYTLRHGTLANQKALRSWNLMGANTISTSSSYVVLKSHSSDTSLGAANYDTASWDVTGITVAYRFFKIQGTGVDSSGSARHVAVSGVEFYGNLTTLGVFNDGYDHDMDYNGVLARLGSENGRQYSADTLKAAGVVFTTGEQQNTAALYLRDDTSTLSVFTAGAKTGMWIMLDLGETRKVAATRYTLRHGESEAREALRNWQFQGSNDVVSWTTLSTHTDDHAISTGWGTYSWTLTPTTAYRFFRVLSTGTNSNSNDQFRVSWIELYGAIQNAQRPTRDVGHAYELGKGVLYQIGTDNGKHPYTPASVLDAGVAVTATRFADGSVLEFLDRVDNLVKTMDAATQFFEIDLGNRKLLPTRYGFRHYETTRVNTPRTWYLEGRDSYGSSPVVLKSHTNDATLDSSNATWSWDVSTTNSFRYFRLRNGANRGSTLTLFVTDMELWGHLSELPAPVNSDGYKHDFDTNGILYKLGTDDDTRSYSVERLKTKHVTVQYPGGDDPYFLLERGAPTSEKPTYGGIGSVATGSENYFVVDFSNLRKVTVKRYTLRHGKQDNTYIIRNWNLEGSDDGRTWTLIKAHTNDDLIQTGYGSGTWVVDTTPPAYRMLRVIQTGDNSGNSGSNANRALHISGVEFYGSITDQTASAYVCEFCGQGAIVDLLTRGGAFTDSPHIDRLIEAGVTITHSTLNANTVAPPWCFFEYYNVDGNCQTTDTADSYVQIDLGAGRTVTSPTHFTLRTGNHHLNRPKNFKLLGSVDTNSWTMLYESTAEFAAAEHTAVTFPISLGNGIAFRHFKILSTGVDSSGNNILRFKGFDVYGTKSSSFVPPLPQLQSKTDGTGFDGVFKQLGVTGAHTTFSETMLSDAGVTAVWNSPVTNVKPFDPLKVVTTEAKTTNAANSFWQVDLGPSKTVTISTYHMRSGPAYLRNWKLQCRETPTSAWQDLHTVTNDAQLTTGTEEITFTPDTAAASASCRIIRLTQTGQSSASSNIMHLRGFEIHGTVANVAVTQQSDGYTRDFDAAGYFYKAGVNQQQTRKYHSTRDLHNIVASAKVLANADPYVPLQRGMPFEGIYIEGWWQVALPSNRRLHVSRYTLQHGDATNSACLTDWYLKASSDLLSFVAIHQGSASTALCHGQATATFTVDAGAPNNNNMRFFRIWSATNFRLGGFELYGTENNQGPEADNYQQDFDENGILYNLGTLDDTVAFSPQRVADAGVTMRFASQAQSNKCDTAYLMDRESGVWKCNCKNAGSGSAGWFEVDMGAGRAVCPSRYTLRHGSDLAAADELRTWDFKGSNDGIGWTVIHSKSGDTSIHGRYATASFLTGLDTSSDQNCYRYFRWYTSTERLTIGGVELYGLKKTRSIPPPLFPGFQYDFDTSGLIYRLGTREGTLPFGLGNLRAQGITNQTSWVGPSLFQRDTFNNPTSSCSASNNQYHWASIDFGTSRRVVATGYSLRHGHDKHDQDLRNWKLEGSNDRMSWTTISQHTNEIRLDAEHGTASWAVSTGGTGYQVFRVISTDINQQVCLKQMEIYGTVNTVTPPSDKYEHDFDTNGVLYHLGSAGKTLPYSVDRLVDAGVTPKLSNLACLGSTQNIACWNQQYWLFNRDQTLAFSLRTNTYTDTTPSVGIDFGTTRRVRPTRYTLKGADNWNDYLTAWDFEGSVDGVTWTVLHNKQSTDTSFSSGGYISMSWPVATTQGFRWFRVKLISNANNNKVIKLTGMEIYGDISEVAPPSDGYKHDFDTNGVIYALGTMQHTRPYSATNTGITATWSSTVSGSVLDKEHPPMQKCTTNTAGESVVLVFPNPLKATRYTLRHGHYLPDRLLRNWKLQGRLNTGDSFVDIMDHTNDRGLMGDYASFSWEITTPDTGYREFKILMTGQSSSGDNYFCISDVEFYGSVLA